MNTELKECIKEISEFDILIDTLSEHEKQPNNNKVETIVLDNLQLGTHSLKVLNRQKYIPNKCQLNSILETKFYAEDFFRRNGYQGNVSLSPVANPKFSIVLSILEIVKASNTPLSMMEIKNIYSKLHNTSKYKTNLSFVQTLHHSKDCCLKRGYMRRLGTDRFKSKYEITLEGIKFLQNERGKQNEDLSKTECGIIAILTQSDAFTVL